MNTLPIRTRRRLAQVVVHTAAAASAVMVVASIAAVGVGAPVSAADPVGTLRVVVPPLGAPLNSGGSGTEFDLVLPTGASCSGDTVGGGFKATSYIVPASVDPSTLTFDAAGPVPVGNGANFRYPLFSATSTPYVDVNTALNSGQVANVPTFSFGVFADEGPTGVASIPAGTFNIGIVCLNETSVPYVFDKYWNVQLTFSRDAADPGGFTWVVTPVDTTPTSTTSTSSTTTTAPPTSSSTSTTSAPSTSTSSSTTSTSSTSSTSTSSTSTTSTIRTTVATQPASHPPAASGSTLPTTGSSMLPIVLWGLLLLVLGRIAILLARSIRVLPPKRR